MNAATASRPASAIVPMPSAGDINRPSLRNTEVRPPASLRFRQNLCRAPAAAAAMGRRDLLHVFRFRCGMLPTHDYQ